MFFKTYILQQQKWELSCTSSEMSHMDSWCHCLNYARPPSSLFECLPTNTGTACLHLVWSPLLLTLLSQTLIASWWQKIVFSQLSKKAHCQSPSWSCGWELMEQPSNFLKTSSHFFSPTGIYKALQTKESDLSTSIPLLAPKSLGRLRWAYLEVSKLQRAPWHMSPNVLNHHHHNSAGTGSIRSRGLPAGAPDTGLLQEFFF